MSDREDEYERDLWRFCAETVADRLCFKRHQGPRILGHCALHQKVRRALLDAIDDVPDLGVLIRKAEPDMMAFAESRITRAQDAPQALRIASTPCDG